MSVNKLTNIVAAIVSVAAVVQVVGVAIQTSLIGALQVNWFSLVLAAGVAIVNYFQTKK